MCAAANLCPKSTLQLTFLGTGVPLQEHPPIKPFFPFHGVAFQRGRDIKHRVHLAGPRRSFLARFGGIDEHICNL